MLGLWSCVDRVSDLHQIHGRVPFIALQRDNAWVVWERRLGGSGTNSSQTHRWRELDSNLRFRARAGSILPVRFVADSLLEEDGFEPTVPLTGYSGDRSNVV